MRTLSLLRHAKSSWDNPALSDLERPLAPRGRRDASRLAAYLQRLAFAPDLVLCSTARRARETFELVRPRLTGPVEARLEPKLYGASVDDLLELLRGVGDEVASLLVIGHNPVLRDLALGLAAPGAEHARVALKFPTAALATLAVAGPRWRDLAEEGAVLTAFLVPKQLP